MLTDRDQDIPDPDILHSNVLPKRLSAETIADRLLYRDGLVLVLDKPAGIAVHKGPPSRRATQPDCLEDYFEGLRFGLPRDPGLGHRLDRDTSGCLVLGRHRKALDLLGRLFKQGRIGKTYMAVVEGVPDTDEGLIDLPLGRLDVTRGWWMKVDPFGQPSQTRWRILAAREGRAVLELTPLTGRTHQLRVHCAAKGWPILGDAIYGPRQAGDASTPLRTPMDLLIPMHLHARTVSLPLSKSKPPIQVEAPIPAHMRPTLADLGLASPA